MGNNNIRFTRIGNIVYLDGSYQDNMGINTGLINLGTVLGISASTNPVNSSLSIFSGTTTIFSGTLTNDGTGDTVDLEIYNNGDPSGGVPFTGILVISGFYLIT